MKSIVVASVQPCAGKTTIIVGLLRVFNGTFGYMKPFGERILYKKKRLVDYDSSLITKIFSVTDNPEEMSIGFDHSKLRYIYTPETLKSKVQELQDRIRKDRDIMIIEGGKDLTFGSSVGLDPINISRLTDSRLILVVGGDDDTIMDSLTFIKNEIRMEDVDFAGVIINKVMDVDDFKENHMDRIDQMGIRVLGIIPYERDLTFVSVEAVSDVLFAKVLAGEEGMIKQVKEIFVGAQSAETALKNPLFSKENKLIITSGDRTDMILAALETDSAAIVLTNNILPSSNMINQAQTKKIPLLLVPMDTFRTAKQIDDMDRLLTPMESDKIALLEKLTRENVDIEAIFE